MSDAVGMAFIIGAATVGLIWCWAERFSGSSAYRRGYRRGYADFRKDTQTKEEKE